MISSTCMTWILDKTFQVQDHPWLDEGICGSKWFAKRSHIRKLLTVQTIWKCNIRRLRPLDIWLSVQWMAKQAAWHILSSFTLYLKLSILPGTRKNMKKESILRFWSSELTWMAALFSFLPPHFPLLPASRLYPKGFPLPPYDLTNS